MFVIKLSPLTLNKLTHFFLNILWYISHDALSAVVHFEVSMDPLLFFLFLLLFLFLSLCFLFTILSYFRFNSLSLSLSLCPSVSVSDLDFGFSMFLILKFFVSQIFCFFNLNRDPICYHFLHCFFSCFVFRSYLLV